MRRVDLKKKPGFTNIAKVYPEPTLSWLLSWCARAHQHSPRRQPLTCSALCVRLNPLNSFINSPNFVWFLVELTAAAR
eukprot:COSAG04_NODE_18701_length_434_cov_1.146269_1_plen_77_part_10